MRIITVDCNAILLGRQGENDALRVRFPVADWIATYGEGVFQLLHRRPGEVTPYPVAIAVEDGCVCWDVSRADTAYPGRGRCELHYYVGGTLAKSAAWVTTVTESLSGTDGEVPEAYQSWMDSVLAAGSEAQASAGTAVISAEAAAESADLAENAAGRATRAAEHAEMSEQNAANSAAAAAASVAAGGYIQLVTEDEHLIAYLYNMENIRFAAENERLVLIYG